MMFIQRAHNIKDFGNIIPGHGGIIDRMDCQIIMAAFTAIFYYNFIVSSGTTSFGLLAEILSLPLNQQMDLIQKAKEAMEVVPIE